MIARIRTLTMSALLVSMLGCAAGTQPKPDWTEAPGADIPAYSTFGFATAPGDAPLTILESQVRNALRAELTKKGYVESADAPDFVVSYSSEGYETAKRSSPLSIGIGVGSWGGNVGGGVGTSVPIGGGKESLSLQNRLTIRAVDPATNREIWIGTSTTFDQAADTRVVERVVAGTLKGFPAKRS